QRSGGVGGRNLVGPAEDRERQFLTRLVLGRQTSKRLLPAPREKVLPDRAPALRLLGRAGVRQHEPPLKAGDGPIDRLAVGRPEQPPDLRPGQRLVVEHGLGHFALERLELVVAEVLRRAGASGQRVSGPEQPRRDQQRGASEVPPRAGEPLLRELVLPPPEPSKPRRELDRLPALVPDRPISIRPGNPLPQ